MSTLIIMTTPGQGANTNEVLLTPANVNPVNIWQIIHVPGGRPYLRRSRFTSGGVAIPEKGIHNVVYVVTEHDSVYGL